MKFNGREIPQSAGLVVSNRDGFLDALRHQRESSGPICCSPAVPQSEPIKLEPNSFDTPTADLMHPVKACRNTAEARGFCTAEPPMRMPLLSYFVLVGAASRRRRWSACRRRARGCAATAAARPSGRGRAVAGGSGSRIRRAGRTLSQALLPASNFFRAVSIAARFLRAHAPRLLTGSSSERPSLVSS